MTSVTEALLDRLAMLNPQDGIPPKTPGADYVIIHVSGPGDTNRRLSGRAAADVIDVHLVAVSRSKEGCRATRARALPLLDGWRPVDHPACSPMTRITTGNPPLRDGPSGDERWSHTTVYRCVIPRGNPI